MSLYESYWVPACARTTKNLLVIYANLNRRRLIESSPNQAQHFMIVLAATFSNLP